MKRHSFPHFLMGRSRRIHATAFGFIVGVMPPIPMWGRWFHFRFTFITGSIFKGAHFPKYVNLYAVFFYLRYAVTYRDLKEIMAEIGV